LLTVGLALGGQGIQYGRQLIGPNQAGCGKLLGELFVVEGHKAGAAGKH
jgi:heme oxygenase